MRTNFEKLTNLTLRKSLSHSGLRAALVVLLIVLGVGSAWASSSKTYYSKMNVAMASGQTGYGTVYVTSSGKTSDTKNSSATSAPTHTYNIYATANAGYKFSTWSGSGITFGSATTANTTGAFSASSTKSSSPTEKTATASFVVVTVNSASPESVNIDPTNHSQNYTGNIVFETSNANHTGIEDFDATPTTDGKFTISWSRTDNNVTAAYTFNGGGTYGGLSRENSTTITLASKGTGGGSKSCTITAKFPDAKIIDGSADEVYATYKAADATQEAVEKTAVFDVEYVDGENNFDTPTFTGADASHFAYKEMNYADGKLTVKYIYNGNKETTNPTHTATLTLKVNNAIGGTDATYGSKSITITAHNEQEATDDAKVIAADGTTLIYQGDWATALSKANTAANAECTLQLLRDVTGITTYQEISNTFTLDLNGKKLTGKYNGSIIYVNKAGKTLTIKDTKTGGRVENINNTFSGIAECVYVNAGNLILESGTLYCENKGTSGRRAFGIYQVAGTTITMNGGRIEGQGYNDTYGIYQASNKNDNTSFTMNGGEIYEEGYSNVYAICAYGKININAGTISALATYNNSRGIHMTASSNATPANCYWGTLTMKGGTVNSTCTADADGTRYAYGVYFETASTAMGTATATDGSHANKASSTGTIENATINASTLGRYSYGVIAYGSYQSKTNTYDVIQIKNSTINSTAQYYYTYGVMAAGDVNATHGAVRAANIELTNCTVNATTTKNHTAYAVWATTFCNTVYQNAQPNYYGEYAGGATVTVNSGTYTATTGTQYAYAIGTSARARTTYGSNSNVTAERTLGGNAEAVAKLNIHGGKFIANAGTTTARAVSNGGDCTIDGGEFEATAGSTTADGIYTVSGKLKASGVKITASATSTVYGIRVDAANVPYSTDAAWTGFNYAGDAELNNLDVTVTARTADKAHGVYVNATAYQYTQSAYDTYMQGRIDAGKVTQANADIWAAVFPGNSSYAIGAKAVINGGTYTVSTATTSAFGVWMKEEQVAADKGAHAAPEASINNAKFTVTTNGTTTAYGVYSGGNVTIDGCDFTVQPKTTTAYGVYQYSNKATITNTKFDVKATSDARLFYANAAISGTHGWDYHGEFELGEGNDGVAKATGGNTAHILTLIASKKNINVEGGSFNGDYANAAKAHITGGSYKATATGTTSYVLNLSDNQVQNAVSAAPSCTIEGGKFWAKADGGTTGICSTNGVMGNILFKGGVYNVNTTLAKHIPEGLEEVTLPSDRPEYTEGYRYEVTELGVHGGYVCQIGSNKYRTLEEALQVVTSNQVIYMIDNYNMLTPGDYILPSGATLLIPYKDGTGKGASTPIGNSAATTTSATTPTLFRKLTFGPGVNLTCFGTIETSAQQKANGQYSANVGMPSGAYGQIHLMDSSHISLESGARLNCWGYITGKGTIEVKNGAAILEGFQLADWCGGSNATTLTGSSNKGKAFPITHYFYQSIECAVTYRPGSKAYGSTHVNMSIVGVVGQDAVPLVGTSDAMFIMDNKDVSEDTWVMKDYDEENDYCYWTINSGASIGNLIVNIPNAMNVNSADYILPICSNMAIVLNYGNGSIGQKAVFLPGSKLVVNKEGTLVLNGVEVSMLDLTEYTGATIYRATYSPTWGTTNPRSTSVKDAELFLHGKVDLKGNGGLYTSASGANIHSTNADAGQVIYTTAAQGNKTTYYLKSSATSATAVTVNPAKLLNGDNTYEESAGSNASSVWIYKDNKWIKTETEGCFYKETISGVVHKYANPGDVLEVTQNSDKSYKDAATGTRYFVWDANCYWWEVMTAPTTEGYYKAITADHNGKYNYYEYNSAADCWKIKTLTVTWNINGTETNYTVGYGTKPKWLGATPTKNSSSSDYVWRWDGWTVGSGTTVLSNDSLPYVTSNTTFTAHFYEKYYQSLVTFKNDDGTVLESKLWNRGSIPSYEGIPTKEATAAQTFEFDESNPWSPAITAVGSSPAEYVAQYTATTRQYNVEFVNYDMSPLGSIKVDYNATPTAATYLEAIAPSTTEPYKPDNNAYSFDFSGWRLNGASSNGFAQVKGDQTYIAQFAQTTKKYLIAFMDDDGETMLHYMQLPYDADIVYDGPAPADFAANKTNDEWCYTFTEWTPVLKAKVDGPQTYTATYKKRSNLVVDITDWSSSQVTLNTTNWALGGWPYTINGITYYQDRASAGSSTNYRADDRTLAIDYDGDPNDEFRICVQNKNGDLYSLHSYVIPYVYTSNTTLPNVKASSVIYVNGCSLTIGSATTVEAIYVASDAELIVNSPLTVTRLVLRTKESEAASLENNSSIKATNTYYTRQVSDMAYHQFALPLGVSSTDNVFLSSHATCPYGKSWLLKSYSEHERASNGMGGSSNWQEVPDKSPIQASVGYEMYSGSAFYREFYFPVDLDEVSTDKKVAVGYTKNASAGDDNAGWNVLCSPLLGKFTQHFDPNNTEDGIKISRWIDGHYEQSAPPVIYPAVPFYYQAKESGKFLYFTGDKMELNISPRKAWNASIPTQWLQLTIHNQYGDRLDETGIYTHPEKFSMNYQSGYDVAKQSLAEGAALLYSELPYGKLAFAAVPDSLAETRIPLTAYAAAEGEYIFSMVESNYLGRLQYVFLHDMQTGLVADLLERDCAVKLAQGTNAERFYIQCVFAAEAPEISTGVNHLKSEPNQAQKILYNDKVYIIYQGRVYDMTGRQCELK